MRTRLLIGALGMAAGLFGALRFLQRDVGDIIDSVLWLAGGVAVHDALVAPLTIAVTWVGGRFVPHGVRTRVALALVVLLTVTAVAIPVLGRFGARPDNPTLLDRNYPVGWLLVAGGVVVASLAARPLATLVGRRRGRPDVSSSAG